MKIAVGISRCNLILINPFQPAVLDFLIKTKQDSGKIF